MVGLAGNCAARHPHHIILGVDAPDLKALGHAITVAHVAGHFGAGKDARLVAAGADVATASMRFGVSVRCWHSFEAMADANALKATVDADHE